MDVQKVHNESLWRLETRDELMCRCIVEMLVKAAEPDRVQDDGDERGMLVKSNDGRTCMDKGSSRVFGSIACSTA